VIAPFAAVAPTAAEVAASRAGDDLVAADVVMDRAFALAAQPEIVWPWLVQLGKQRAGWYLPRSVERFIPPSRKAVRHLDPIWQELSVGDIIPDYGGRHETFEVAIIQSPQVIVYRSTRGRVNLTWSITLTPLDGGTRVHLRLRLGPVRRQWLARTVGNFFDLLTIAGMAAGLAERLATTKP
jgi:hypothetical protein